MGVSSSAVPHVVSLSLHDITDRDMDARKRRGRGEVAIVHAQVGDTVRLRTSGGIVGPHHVWEITEAETAAQHTPLQLVGTTGCIVGKDGYVPPAYTFKVTSAGDILLQVLPSGAPSGAPRSALRIVVDKAGQ